MIYGICKLCDIGDNCMIVGPKNQEYLVCNQCYWQMKEEEE